MSRSVQIAVAVAAALGAASGAALAAPPTLAQAAAAPVTLYIAGSSAAKAGILSAIQTNLCGNTTTVTNSLTFSSQSNTNFFAVSCVIASSTGLSEAGQIATVYYRDEGGSVVGALPIITGKTINTLNLSDTTNVGSCPTNSTTCSPTVTGTSANNGVTDSFGGAVVKKAVQLGVTDLEPAVFIGANDNYPTAYVTSVFGKASPAQMAQLSSNATPLFQQVFALFVNTNSSVFSTAEKNVFNTTTGALVTAGSLSISKAALTNVLQGNLGDWSQVPDVTGAPVASSSLSVALTNRESGSGSRAGASIYFTGDECVSGATTLSDPSGAAGDSFATGDVLKKANLTAGAVTYASIDNYSTTTYPNLVPVYINGIKPSNLAAAQGQYDYWFEATGILAPNVSGSSADLGNWLIGELQAEASAPNIVDVLAIPGIGGNSASLPVSGTQSGNIYVNYFTRNGVSCSSPGVVVF
jgi:hypothetical protein